MCLIYIPYIRLFTTAIGISLIGGMILLSWLPRHFSAGVAMCVYSSELKITYLHASQYFVSTCEGVD